MARGKQVDRELVELILQMKERNPKLTTEQIGAVTNCDASTAGKIIKCGSWEGYCEFRKEKARKQQERARKAAEEQPAEEQVPGQISMELPEKPAEEEKPDMSDQTKMMRFLAGKFNELEQNQQICIGELILQVGKIQDSMNQVKDYMAQILRRMDK